MTLQGKAGRPLCCLLVTGLILIGMICLAAVITVVLQAGADVAPNSTLPSSAPHSFSSLPASLAVRVSGGDRSDFPLPRFAIVDSHHHYADPQQVANSFLKETKFTPEDYAAALEPLKITKSVHIEIMPDDALAECRWVESLIAAGRARDAAIVASCNLADNDVEVQLKRLTGSCPHVRGIRYILDYVGPYDGKSATHVAVTRHNFDYLRDPIEVCHILFTMISSLSSNRRVRYLIDDLDVANLSFAEPLTPVAHIGRVLALSVAMLSSLTLGLVSTSSVPLRNSRQRRHW